MQKIIKNTTLSNIEIKETGISIPAENQYIIPKTDYNLWASNALLTEIDSDLNSGNLVINNGNEDLNYTIGKEHLTCGVIKVHRDVNIKIGVGINAPEIITIGNACCGFNVDIGDKGYFDTRLDNVIGNILYLDFHYCINNDSSDKYVKFKIYITSSTGSEDNYLNQTCCEYDFGPFEVINDPYKIKNRKIQLPTQLIESNRKYLFVAIERIAPGDGYDSPTNNPIIVRICKEYWKRVIT
jgi:hypothetical protein